MTDEVEVGGVGLTTSAAIGIGHTEVELPSRFIVKRDLGAFELEWRWRTHARPSVFFTSALPAVGVAASAWYGVGVFDLPAALAIAATALSAGAVLYQMSRWLVNRATLRAQYGHLGVEHRPLPWPALSFALADVQSLEVEEDGRRPQGFSVVVHTIAGARHVLVGMLETREQAAFVARTIEQQLGVVGVGARRGAR